MKGFFFAVVMLAIMFFISACDDQGDPVTANVPTPVLTSVSPDSGKANDTVTVDGTNFGSSQGSSNLSFGGTNVSAYISWGATQIKVIVPSGLSSGSLNVTVVVGGKSSNAKSFKSLSSVSLVKFSTDIAPLIAAYNCASCHGGGSTFNNFKITSYNNLMLGNSSNGPVVTPNNGANSVIVKKLLGTAGFGARMPQSGPPYLTNVEIQKFIDWINQGALNN